MNEHLKQNCIEPENTRPSRDMAFMGAAVGGLVIALTIAAPFMILWGLVMAAELLDSSDSTTK